MRFFLLTLALLLALPAAAASVTVSTPSFTATAATVDGDMPVIDYRSTDGAGSAQLSLDAARLVVETDTVAYLQAGVTAVGSEPPSTSRTDYGTGRVLASVTGQQSGLFLVPTGELTVHATAGRLEGSVPADSCRQQPDYFENDRPLACPDVTNALSFRGSQRVTMLLNGSFTMFLWGWDGSVEGQSRSDSFWSGTRYDNSATPAVGRSEHRQVVLHVEGTLELTAGSSALPELLLASTRLSAAQVSLATDLGAFHLANGTMELARSGANISAKVLEGAVTRPDGTVVNAGASKSANWAWLAVVGTVMVAAPSAFVGGRAARARLLLRRARESVVLGNYHAAARHAEQAMTHKPSRVEAGILGAIALIRSGDTQDAKHFIAQLTEADPAAVAYLRACAAARSGHPREARRWLADCFERNPAYEREAQANPILAGVADRGAKEGGGAYT